MDALQKTTLEAERALRALKRDRAHREQLAKSCIKDAKADWGNGWYKLSQSQRAGAVALKVLAILSARANSDAETSGPLERMDEIAFLALHDFTDAPEDK